MHKIFAELEFQLDMLTCLINNLSDLDYKKGGKHIHSIGSHLRHMVEYMNILINTDFQNPLDYASRPRNNRLETDRMYAVAQLSTIKEHLYKEDRVLHIVEDDEIYTSSYNREMLYMHEHIVHHCALLKIELNELEYIDIDPCFGYAKSTLKHMKDHVTSSI